MSVHKTPKLVWAIVALLASIAASILSVVAVWVWDWFAVDRAMTRAANRGQW